jgi:hypothetical protein
MCDVGPLTPCAVPPPLACGQRFRRGYPSELIPPQPRSSRWTRSAHPQSLTPAARPWRIAAARPRLRLRGRLWPSRASARASGTTAATRLSNELGCCCRDAWLAAACAHARWRGCGSRAAPVFGLSCCSAPVAPRTRSRSSLTENSSRRSRPRGALQLPARESACAVSCLVSQWSASALRGRLASRAGRGVLV